MCGTPKPQPNVTYKGHQYSAAQAGQAAQLTQAYNQQNAMGRAMAVASGRKFKAKPIKQTKYYSPAAKAWDEYDASVQAQKNAPAAAPADDTNGKVLKTGSDLGQAKVRKNRDPNAFGRSAGKAIGRMTIR